MPICKHIRKSSCCFWLIVININSNLGLQFIKKHVSNVSKRALRRSFQLFFLIRSSGSKFMKRIIFSWRPKWLEFDVYFNAKSNKFEKSFFIERLFIVYTKSALLMNNTVAIFETTLIDFFAPRINLSGNINQSDQ